MDVDAYYGPKVASEYQAVPFPTKVGRETLNLWCHRLYLKYPWVVDIWKGVESLGILASVGLESCLASNVFIICVWAMRASCTKDHTGSKLLHSNTLRSPSLLHCSLLICGCIQGLDLLLAIDSSSAFRTLDGTSRSERVWRSRTRCVTVTVAYWLWAITCIRYVS